MIDAQQVKKSVLGVCLGVALKWMLGSDDLVWLSPFMARGKVRHKLRMAVKYVASVVFLTLLACILGMVISSAAGSSGSAVADKAIGTSAGILLLCYAVHMAREEGYFDRCSPLDAEDDLKDGNYGATQLTPMKSGDDDDDDDEGGPITDAIATGLASTSSVIDTLLCCGDTEDEDADLEKDEKASKDVLVVAFLGSMDDFMARGRAPRLRPSVFPPSRRARAGLFHPGPLREDHLGRARHRRHHRGRHDRRRRRRPPRGLRDPHELHRERTRALRPRLPRRLPRHQLLGAELRRVGGTPRGPTNTHPSPIPRRPGSQRGVRCEVAAPASGACVAARSVARRSTLTR